MNQVDTLIYLLKEGNNKLGESYNIYDCMCFLYNTLVKELDDRDLFDRLEMTILSTKTHHLYINILTYIIDNRKLKLTVKEKYEILSAITEDKKRLHGLKKFSNMGDLITWFIEILDLYNYKDSYKIISKFKSNDLYSGTKNILYITYKVNYYTVFKYYEAIVNLYKIIYPISWVLYKRKLKYLIINMPDCLDVVDEEDPILSFDFLSKDLFKNGIRLISDYDEKEYVEEREGILTINIHIDDFSNISRLPIKVIEALKNKYIK